jgi:hypothetical protein
MPIPTSDDIETAWESAIWQHSDILEMTSNIYPYDVSAESEFDIDKLCLEGEVNFFLAKTSRASEPILTQSTRYTFTVVVEYYLQQTDIAESTYRTLRDRLETLDDLVLTSLGKTWTATVDYCPGGNPQPIREVTISGRRCWFGAIVYTAFKTT